jgi:tetratricopeptide (TPR) repeat protein
MDKVRAKSEQARPVSPRVRTVEASDPTLAAALLAVSTQPTTVNHRAVAARYVQLGILDQAHEHFSAAVRLDPTDAASWDGLARIWRDWGFPHLALSDAYRAVYHAPDSPTVHNTLGTVLQALGRRAAAKAAFERALALDVTAAYALSNLCHAWRLEGNASKAAEACRQALQLQPDLEPARNNLALAYEAAGDRPAALATLAASGDKARAAYNQGLIHLARREYGQALKSFDLARAERPRFRAAEAIARQVRAHLLEVNQP